MEGRVSGRKGVCVVATACTGCKSSLDGRKDEEMKAAEYLYCFVLTTRSTVSPSAATLQLVIALSPIVVLQICGE